MPAPRADLPKVGPAPLGDLTHLKLLELEQRILGLEAAIIEVCMVIKKNQETANLNTLTIEKNFLNLANYVMRPRTQIMGESQDKN